MDKLPESEISLDGVTLSSRKAINMKAAEVAEHKPYESVVTSGIVLIRDPQLARNSERPFDIFANTPQGAYDREQVVIALMIKHRTVMISTLSLQGGSYWTPMRGDNCVCGAKDSYPEAVAAACDEVMI